MSDKPDFKLCPKGHPVGQSFGGGKRCSSVSCGKQRHEESLANPKPIEQKMPESELAYIKRKNLARIPDEAMDGEKAVDWAKERLAQMVPEAVARLQWDLRYGSDKAQSEAAAKVMAANGLDKREAAVSRNMPTIVLNIGTDSKVPWLERMPKKKE